MKAEPFIRRPAAPVFAGVAALLACALLSPSAQAQFTLNAYSSAPAFVSQSASTTVFQSLTFTASSVSSLDGLSLGLYGDVPSQNAVAWLYEDGNANGVIDAGDAYIASNTFSGGTSVTPPTAYLQLTAGTKSFGAGQTRRYFILLSWTGFTAGRTFSVGFKNDWQIMTSPSFLVSSSMFPIASADSSVQLRLEANPYGGANVYPVPYAIPASGGYDTGMYLQKGQTLQVAASGSWNGGSGIGLVTSTGTATTGGLDFSIRLGALAARVGGGSWFQVGTSTVSTYTTVSPGNLYLAMNDSSYGAYSDNSGFLDLSLQVAASTSAKIWVGGTAGFETMASVDANWIGGRPYSGEDISFSTEAVADCDWDIANLDLRFLSASNGFHQALRLKSSGAAGTNTLSVSSDVLVAGGTFYLGYQSLSVSGKLVVKDSATLDFSDGYTGSFGTSNLSVGSSLVVSSHAFLRAEGVSANVHGTDSNKAFDFEIQSATVTVGGTTGMFMVSGSSRVILGPSIVVNRFDKVMVMGLAGAGGPFVVFKGPPAITATFNEWNFPGPGAKNVDASALPGGSAIVFKSAGGSIFGSPKEIDPQGVVAWSPDGGGISGSLSGSVSTPGNTGTFVVRITTDPTGLYSPGTSYDYPVTLAGSAMPYNASGLTTPASYYLFVYQGTPGNNPAPFARRGGWNADGSYAASPIFIDANGSTSVFNPNPFAGEWGQVSGSVTNLSTQTGSVRVEAWAGTPYVAASTRLADGYFSGAYSLDARSGPGVSLIAYVDANYNGQLDAPYEGSVSSANLTIPNSSSLAGPSLDILTAGAPVPGGTITVSSQSLHQGVIGSMDDSAVLRVDFAASGGAGTVSGVVVRYSGAFPAMAGGIVKIGVYEDTNRDGQLTAAAASAGAMDTQLGSFMAMPGTSSGTVSFWTPLSIPSGETRSLIFTINMYGSIVSSAAVAVDSPANFVVTAGELSPSLLFPLASSPASARQRVYANMSAWSWGWPGGNVASVPVYAGQTIDAVYSSGTWSVDAVTTVDARGVSGTEYQNTVVPSARLGELIANIQPFGQSYGTGWFRLAGATFPLSVAYDGSLYLAVNDYESNYYDNSGSLLVDYRVSGSTLGVLSGQVFYSTPVAGTVNLQAWRVHRMPGAASWSESMASLTFTVTTSSSYPYQFDSLPPGEYQVKAVHSPGPDFGDSVATVEVAAGHSAVLNVRMYGGLGSITGSIAYAGSQYTGDFKIGVTTVSNLSGNVVFYGGASTPSPGSYSVTGLPSPNTYYVLAYRDTNYNDQPDGPEPFGYYGAPGAGLFSLTGALTPVFVPVSGSSSSVNFAVYDLGSIDGSISLPSGATGHVLIQVGQGDQGASNFTAENLVDISIPVTAAPAAYALPYSVGLLRAATNYSVYAFRDANGDGVLSAGEESYLSSADISVPMGGRANHYFSLALASAPAAVSGFYSRATVSGVEFDWNKIPGAIGYKLLNSTGGLAATVAASASYYLDVLPTNTSSQILGIAAVNPNGAGAVLFLSSGVYTLCASPSALSTGTVNAASAVVTWSAAGNPAGTVYELWRANSSGGTAARVSSGTALSFLDSSLAPSKTYYWKVRAINGNGVASSFGAENSGTTGATAVFSAAGDVTYGGAQAGRLVVQAASDSLFATIVSSGFFPSGVSPQRYYLPVPASASYYFRAYIDVSGTGAMTSASDRYVGSSAQSVSAKPTTLSFTISVDTVPPAGPAGLLASPQFKSVRLTWSAPTKSADGSALSDLAGFEVQRSSTMGVSWTSLTSALSSTTLSYVDTTALLGMSNLYRVLARDLGSNASQPSGVVTSMPSSGGTIGGALTAFAVASNGQYRVRLATTAAPGAAAVAEITVTTYVFTGLPDGIYYLRAFRDVNGDGVEQTYSEPGGTYGGLNSPFAVQIQGGNAATGADAVVCDRVLLAANTTMPVDPSTNGCPARDKGTGFTTKLFAVRVGDGSPGSLGLGSSVTVSASGAAYDTEIIVLGPDGREVARDNRSGGAAATFTASVPGVYLVEPTSFLPGYTGGFQLSLRVDGGFAGAVSGTMTYSGSRPGTFYVQLYSNSSQTAFPLAVSTYAAAGSFAMAGLPDGIYYLRAFRDSNSNGVRDPGEPSGAYGASASSAAAISINGGVAVPAAPHNLTISDPAVGAVRGSVLYDGTKTGNLIIQAGQPRCSGCSDMDSPVASTVALPGQTYLLPFLPPASNYLILSFIDGNGNGRADALEPQISSSGVTVVAYSTTSLGLVLQDPGSGASGSAVIVGTVSYAGSSTGAVMVGFSRDSSFRYIDYLLQLPSTGYFERSGVLGGMSYYMAAFIDRNGDAIPEDSEPSGVGAPAGFVGMPSFSSAPAIWTDLYGHTSAQLLLQDPPSGQIKGLITYGGTADASYPLVVQAGPMATAAGGSNRGARVSLTRSAGVSRYSYSLDLLAADTYYVSAFLDFNGNGMTDPGEPYGNLMNGVSVSSGSGTYPYYGADFQVLDSGSLGVASTAGRLRGDVSYLGVQSGPIYIRAFGNSSLSGQPLYSARIPLAAGPGFVEFSLPNMAFGAYYLDAFRDPSDTGLYNPTFHAHTLFNRGDAVTVSPDHPDTYIWGGDMSDPGEGGSVNAYSGSFAAPGGVRFDGGATDISAAIAIDSYTAGAPQPIVLGMTNQNDGQQAWLVRYSSGGAPLATHMRGQGSDMVGEFSITLSGDIVMSGALQFQDNGGMGSSATLTRLSSNFASSTTVILTGMEHVGGLGYSRTVDRLYLASTSRSPLPYNRIMALKINPGTLAVESTGYFDGSPIPGASCGAMGCWASVQGSAVAADGSAFYVVGKVNLNDSSPGLRFLLKFDGTGAGDNKAPLLKLDISDLDLPSQKGGGVEVGPSGEVYVAGVRDNSGIVSVYKYDSNLVFQASTTFSPVLLHFEGGIGNVKVDSTDGNLYMTWESTGRGGDITVLRYSPQLVLRSRQDFDGFNGTLEDFPFSLSVYNSSMVYVTGAVNNGRNLDWASFRVNMNASGSSSSSGTAVAITTANATNFISGFVSYAGAASSGTFRTVLIPAGQTVPIRFSSAPFAAAAAYLFNNVPYGRYDIRTFLDLNGNFNPDAGEPIGYTDLGGAAAGAAFSGGFYYSQGSSLTIASVALCDRYSIQAGAVLTDSLSLSDCSHPVRAGSRQRLYTFTGRRGQPVDILMNGVGFVDTYLELIAPDNRLMAYDDDGGGNRDARISGLVLQQDGLYTIAASAVGKDVTGAFRLSLSGSAGSLGSIAGNVDYQGSQGGRVQVGLFSSPTFSSATFMAGQVLLSTRVFRFDNLFTGSTYYLAAFVDVNYNNNPDPGEDSGFFGTSVPSPLYLSAGQNMTGASIVIAPSTSTAVNSSYLTGTVTYGGTKQGQMVVEFWASAQMTGRPVAVRAVPTGVGTYDVSVPGGANYYVRAFLDVNGDFIPNLDEPRGIYAPSGQGAEPVYASLGQTVLHVDVTLKDPGATASGAVAGEGTAALIPGALSPGQSATLRVVYTAGSSGISAGGTVGFSVPNAFPFPGPYAWGSSVTARNTAGATLSAVTYAGPSAYVSVAAGSVPSGQQISLEWSNFYVPCAVAVQTVTVSAVQNNSASPAPLYGGSPQLSILAGQPKFFQPQSPYFSSRQGELSDAQVLEARDFCGNRAPVASASTVTVRAVQWSMGSSDFVADSNDGLTDSVSVSTTSTLDLFFDTGVSSRSFYVVGITTGFHNLQMVFDLGMPSTYYYGLTVVPANALTAVSVSSATSGQALSSATIAAAATGVINQVFINFSLGDPSQSWHVLFSSVPYKSGVYPIPVWERWGYGQPSLNEIAWDGRYSPWINGGNRAPNGLYYGRVELGGGGVKDDSIKVRVSLPQFAGRVYDANGTPSPPLSGAVLRVYGPSGYYTNTTDGGGNYVLPGLGAGSYRLNTGREDYVDGAVDMTLDASGLATSFLSRTAGLSVSSNSSGGLDILLSRAPRLSVVPSLAVGVSTQSMDMWGSLQVQPSTGGYQQTIFGPMRLRAGTTTFDDGGQWDPASQQFVLRELLKFNVPVGTYTVIADLPGFSRSSATVYVGADGLRLNLAAFQRKSTIAGTVAIPGPNLAGLYVSVVGLSTAANASMGFGGAYLPPGVLSAPYLISGLDGGTYMLRANAQGFSSVSTGPIILAAQTDLFNVHFATLGAGALLSGVITIPGASAGMPVYLNAWSPGSFNFGSTINYVVGGAVNYSMNGLDAGATYQFYANISGQGDYDVPGGFPMLVSPPATLSFAMAPSSGVISALIKLPSGASDFLNVDLQHEVVSSLRASDAGRSGIDVSTGLPGFSCGGLPASNASSSPVAGYCPGFVSSATFLVTGMNTQTIDVTVLYRTTGQSVRQRLSVVNGSTISAVADLSGATYSIGGAVVNQITNPTFNTNAKIVANAPFIAPQGWPAGLSSSTARVTAVRQEISNYGVAISTVFNPVTSRVGFYDAAGAFTIPNVPNGVYFVRTADLRSCATCAVLVPKAGKIVSVAGAAVSSVTITLSDGYSMTGTLTLDNGISDALTVDLSVVNRRQEVVASTRVYIGDPNLGTTANSVDYSFVNLPAGEFYTLLALDAGSPARYAGRPIKFPDPALSPNGLQSSLAGQNLTLQRAAYIVGRLKDAGTGEQITALNAGLLAPNFRISATANPWIEGGYVTAASSVAGRPIFADGYFRVGPLVPNVTYDLRLAQTSWDPSFMAMGSQNYAPAVIGGLKPTPGESQDVGVVSLSQGRSLTGVVRSTATGASLGNVKVTARPSFVSADVFVQTYTNQQGRYSLWVSTALSNQFDVTAAPRDGNTASDGLVYGQVVLRNVNLLATTTADFLLTPLTVAVTGQVVVEDAAAGGQLSYPFGDKRGFPAAAVNLQPKGEVSASNPLGDIETVTDERGSFSILGLSTGVYTLHATSLGYGVFNATVSVGGSGFRIFTGSDTASNNLAGSILTLHRGASVTGRILKSDGSAPSGSEVSGIAAANFTQGEFVVGSVELDPNAKTVNSYTISGFRTGVSYDLVLISGEDGREVSFPPEGGGIVFASQESTTTKTLTLTFRPSRLDCLGNAKALDANRTQFLIQVDCLKPLRKQVPGDDDLDALMSVSTYTSAGAALVPPDGAGQFLAGTKVLATSRRLLTGVYQIAAGERRFSVRLRAASATVDPATGDSFTIDKVFDFYTGLDSHVDGRIKNIDGGSVDLPPSAQDEEMGLDERSRLNIPPGAFAEGSDSLLDSSAVAQPTTTVNVTMTKGRDRTLAQTLYLKTRGYLPASLASAGPEDGGTFPAETWAAMRAYRSLASTTTVGGANPLSSFYSIFLPAGIRHQLKQKADLTLSYTLLISTTDPNSVNVWFYNATLGRFVLENTNRRLDTVNKTVTVSVDHFSTFVVLDSTPIVSVAGGFSTSEIVVANFPNPSDCVIHSNIQRNSTLFGSGGTHAPFSGTMIRTSLPTGAADHLKYNIYNVAGEKVRTIEQGVVSGGMTHYTPWNCASDGGGTVSSGIYIGEVVWGGRRKYFKIAIIKGSGL